MELKHDTTKPSVRSTVKFSEPELITILHKHLVVTGYSLNKRAAYCVFFPHSYDGGIEHLCLVATMFGENEPIKKTHKKVRRPDNEVVET
ncbi:MAG: hypothetical protein MUP81_01665 [Dehalococcoidia bacterium]|nr:hypothetical protein [Dehalococcoidia bacterium]